MSNDVCNDACMVDRRVRRWQACAYCGSPRTGSDKDHVIPRCLFGKPQPNDLLVIPVCKDCNSRKSLDDDYLRDMLVLNWQASSQQARAAPFEKMQRSVRRNKSVVGRVAKKSGRLGAEFTPAGIYLGETIHFPLDTARVENIFTQIVRGLFYWVTREQYMAAYQFDVREVNPLYANEIADYVRSLGHNRLFIGDAQVFDSLFVIDTDDRFRTRWLLRFYTNIFITVFTDPTNTPIATGENNSGQG